MDEVRGSQGIYFVEMLENIVTDIIDKMDLWDQAQELGSRMGST